MVSFQCDACADVVKKPKLDQHRVRCGAPFTCIDCSQTFQTPVDWKGHTSCISEAQKYQGALYKPKQNGSSRENQSYGGARGNLQGRGGPWNRPPPRSQATGANGTPLGTPPRMSPVTAPPSVQDGKSTATAIPPAVSIEANEKPSKHKKQRSEGVSTVEVEAVDNAVSQEESKPKDKKKDKKKEKKDKHEKGSTSEAAVNGADTSLPLVREDVADEKLKKSKKNKKDKKDESPNARDRGEAAAGPPVLTSEANVATVDGEEQKKKKKKKQKSEAANEDTEMNNDHSESPALNTTPALSSEKKKSKKRKREVGEQSGEVVEQVEEGTKKIKKKKKDPTS